VSPPQADPDGPADTAARIVHVLSPESAGDEGVLACAAAMAIPGFAHTCVIVGDDGHERRAWALGVPSVDRLTPLCRPVGQREVWLSPTGRRLAAVLGARLAGEPGPALLCTWSARDLALVRAAAGKRGLKRVGVLAHAPDAPHRPDQAHHTDWAWGMDEATVVTIGSRVRARIARAASARRGGRMCVDDVRLCPAPAFERGGPLAVDREALRSRLGIEPGDTVVGLLADPPCRGDALGLAFQLGLCWTIGRPMVGLMPRGVAWERQGLRFVIDHGRAWRMLNVHLSLPELVAVSDVAVAQATERGPSCGLVALSLCASVGVPVACHPGVVGDCEDADQVAPALAALDDERNRLAVPLLRLVEDAAAAAELVRRQRAFADRARAADGFARTLAGVWRETLNLPEASADLPTPAALVGGPA
jgi:hypothetical protein